jgi:hypothetical protein
MTLSLTNGQKNYDTQPNDTQHICKKFKQCHNLAHYAVCRYAECRYAECHYAKSRGATNLPSIFS